MNVLEFTNAIYVLTNDFTTGATDEQTFKSGITDLLLKVGAPLLDLSQQQKIEESPEYEFVKNAYEPGKKGDGDFFTMSDIEMRFLVYYQQKKLPNTKLIARSLEKLNCERVSFRKAQYPVYGYWLKKIA